MHDTGTMSDTHPLGPLLKVLRDRTAPQDVGMPAGGRRRVPGLRREEVASLSDLSVDYVVQLEQGRAARPSPQVVSSLARALRLSVRERDQLFLAAGLLPPSSTTASQHVSPGVQRIVTQLSGTPVAVYDATWTLLQRSALWSALHGDRASVVGSNLVRDVFLAAGADHLTAPRERDRFKEALVADLRTTTGRYPRDRRLRAFVDEMSGADAQFRALWDATTGRTFGAERKRIDHPLVGTLVLDCDVLTTFDDDLRVVVYTAPPTGASARQLALLDATRPATTGRHTADA